MLERHPCLTLAKLFSDLEASQNRCFLIDKLVENERVWGLSAPDGLWDARLTDHARPLPQPVAGDLPQPYVFHRKITKSAPRCQANARFSRMGTRVWRLPQPVAGQPAMFFDGVQSLRRFTCKNKPLFLPWTGAIVLRRGLRISRRKAQKHALQPARIIISCSSKI